MKSKTRITRHAKRRIKERLSTDKRNESLSRMVHKNGLSKGLFCGKFYQYLASKSSSGVKVKVYKDNIYIFSKNTKRLITTYAIPEKYLPIEQWKLSLEILQLKEKISYYHNLPVVITLKNKKKFYGYISNDYEFEIDDKVMLIDKNRYKKIIKLKYIYTIDVDEKKLSIGIKEMVGV